MQGTDTIGIVLAYLFIGLIFGLVNAFVKPLVSLLSLPITILTLGLFTVVINAAMLYLTSWLSSYTPVHFTIDSFFWTAVFAAIIITVISLVGRLAARGAVLRPAAAGTARLRPTGPRLPLVPGASGPRRGPGAMAAPRRTGARPAGARNG